MRSSPQYEQKVRWNNDVIHYLRDQIKILNAYLIYIVNMNFYEIGSLATSSFSESWQMSGIIMNLNFFPWIQNGQNSQRKFYLRNTELVIEAWKNSRSDESSYFDFSSKLTISLTFLYALDYWLLVSKVVWPWIIHSIVATTIIIPRVVIYFTYAHNR